MRRRRVSRFLFFAAAAAAVTAIGGAAVVALHPTTAERVFVAHVDELAPGRLLERNIPELDGLDRRARVDRMGLAGVLAWPRRAGAGDLPVFVVRDGDAIRVYVAADPRSGCRLEFRPPVLDPHHSGGVTPWAFHDTCHGSLYDVGGRPVGGPGPWHVDELRVTVEDGAIYADARVVVPGRLAAPRDRAR